MDTTPTTHTPGPWALGRDDRDNAEGYYRGKWYMRREPWHVVGDEATVYIAEVEPSNAIDRLGYLAPRNAADANARLIAAAPALLEAAQAMYELHKDGVSHQLQFHQRAAALEVLRAAITTATGEEK